MAGSTDSIQATTRPSRSRRKAPYRYADLRFDPARRRFLAIREDHSGDGEPRAAIVDIALDGERPPRVLYEGPDFLARAASVARRPAARLARVGSPGHAVGRDTAAGCAVLDDGGLGPSDLAARRRRRIDRAARVVARRHPPLRQRPDGLVEHLPARARAPGSSRCPRIEAEFADPAWLFDRSSYGFLPDGSIVAVGRARGRDRLFHISPDEAIGEVASPYTDIGTIRVGAAGIVANVGTPTVPPTIVSIEPATLATSGVLRHSTSIAVDPAYVSIAEPITFPTAGGRMAHGLFYRPVNPDAVAPDGELPPLVVRSHGGPTSNAANALELGPTST